MSTPTLEEAIAAAPCLGKNDRCTPGPITNWFHPECAAAAARAWFHSYLESEEVRERVATAIETDPRIDTEDDALVDLIATVVTNALREGNDG